jgi:NAD(P)-dependent dehydrogenase (short-subunit alcohol dehydrogenase family)
MTQIAGQVAVITGAASGIGRGSAMSLARRGARVVLADIDSVRVAETVEAIGSEGGSAIAIAVDMAHVDSVETVRRAALDQYNRVDIVMNNVGVLVSGAPEDIPLAEWERIINLNLMSVIRSIHLFIPDLIQQGHGHIVNTASFAGLFPYAFDRLPYAATKAAIITLSEGLALYLKPKGIGVTCLCPGPVRTAISKGMKSWTPGLTLRGPGPQFGYLEPGEVGEMVADAIESNRFFLPTDIRVKATMERHAADPDAFLAEQIRGFSRS